MCSILKTNRMFFVEVIVDSNTRRRLYAKRRRNAERQEINREVKDLIAANHKLIPAKETLSPTAASLR